jgi:hypothetical protein
MFSNNPKIVGLGFDTKVGGFSALRIDDWEFSKEEIVSALEIKYSDLNKDNTIAELQFQVQQLQSIIEQGY